MPLPHPPRDRLRHLLTPRRWPRLLALRRVIAALLVLLAAVLAVRPPPPAPGESPVPMLVAARDLAPGSALRPADLRVVHAPAALRPATALTSAEQATDRVLASATARGEPITRARLVGPENSHLTTGDPSAVAVPVRLADPAVAALLAPGTRVDVVTAVAAEEGAASVPEAALLAANATVVTVRTESRPTAHAPGPLVVIAVGREVATKVASVSLGQPVAVTLR